MSWSKSLIVIAITLGPVVLVLLSLSLSTNYWITYTVDRTKLPSQERVQSVRNASLSYYHSRSRGIFRECFVGEEVQFLDRNRNSECVNIMYEPPASLRNVASQDYWNRLHLMRCHFAFLVVGLAAFLLAYMLSVVLCCQKKPIWAKSSGVFAYLSAFSSASSVAFFHGVEYIERSVVLSHHYGHMFYANWSKGLQDATVRTYIRLIIYPMTFTARDYKTRQCAPIQLGLQDATVRTYDWSYILCWVGAVMAAICGTLYVIAAWLIQNEHKNDDSRKVLPKRYLSEHGGPGPMMMADGGPYAYDDPHFNKYYYPQAYLGPYMYEMNDGAYPGYGEPAQPMWQWQ